MTKVKVIGTQTTTPGTNTTSRRKKKMMMLEASTLLQGKDLSVKKPAKTATVPRDTAARITALLLDDITRTPSLTHGVTVTHLHIPIHETMKMTRQADTKHPPPLDPNQAHLQAGHVLSRQGPDHPISALSTALVLSARARPTMAPALT